MMKKTIRASTPIVVKAEKDQPAPTFAFTVGSKYLSGGQMYTVRKAYYESNTDFRLVYSDANREEIVLLSHLLKLTGEKDFHVLHDADSCKDASCSCQQGKPKTAATKKSKKK